MHHLSARNGQCRQNLLLDRGPDIVRPHILHGTYALQYAAGQAADAICLVRRIACTHYLQDILVRWKTGRSKMTVR